MLTRPAQRPRCSPACSRALRFAGCAATPNGVQLPVHLLQLGLDAEVIGPSGVASNGRLVWAQRRGGEALYTVALAVGLRQGEALGLRWEDVDFEAGELHVRHSLQRNADGRLELGEPKSATSRRTIALPAVAMTALREHRRRQLEEQLLAGSRWRDHGLVFTSTIGTPADGTAITKRFQRLLADAGLPRQRFHDLRHACASLLLAQGIHPRVVMEILGHSQISLTMNTYSHVVPELQREAANSMETLLTAGGQGS